MGDRLYDKLHAELKPGEHLFVLYGNGTSSFKGSAFVRGGIFDRVRISQGLKECVFRDTDYTPLSHPATPDAPRFKEGAAFVCRSAQIDPGTPFDLVFLGSVFTGPIKRDFREFRASMTLPPSVYVRDVRVDEPMYVQTWREQRVSLVIFSGLLLVVMGLFTARRFLTASLARVQWIHFSSMLVAFVLFGIVWRAQPSVTQVLTAVQSIFGEWRWELFLSAPFIFIFWIFIVIVSVIWGRGVFCGWVCPYGAATELLNKIGRRLKLPQFELPGWLGHTRYGVLAILIVIFLISPIHGERAAEIEPFKTAFFIRPWAREWYYLLWFVILAGASLFVFRPFCRILCPLGGALAILGSFRFAGPHRIKFCSKCNICAKGCEPRAIRPDGTINPRECLSCMDCEATYRDEKRCPPLVGIARLRVKGPLSEHDRQKLAELHDWRRPL
jgi:NosR/NirI family nitrous oxide reductase transcriptional regulator